MHVMIIVQFLLFSLITRESSQEGRIVGGLAARIQEYPYQASLQINGFHVCGASIININHVITAAHCVNGVNPRTLSIHVGSRFAKVGGTSRNVSNVNLHEKYDNLTSDYDIAVIKLGENFTFTESISPIYLPRYQAYYPPNTLAIVTGWGYTKEGGSLSATLMQTRVPLVSLRQCSVLYSDIGRITSRMLCAGPLEGGVDACQGDSGGPLVVNYELVGIVSWGYGCARPNHPGVYTNVPTFTKWINRVVNATSHLVSTSFACLLILCIICLCF